MKRTLALLLTLAMLLTMVGTVAVAADAATAEIPEFTATLAKDGTVTVKLDDGVKDYSTAEAYLRKFDEDNKITWSGWVELEYDSSKKAYIGKNEDAAGAQFSSVNLNKNETKLNDKGDVETYKRVSFEADYTYYEGILSNAEYSTKSGTRKYTKDGKDYRWVLTDESEDYYKENYNYEEGKLSSVTHSSYELTGDTDEQKVKATNETKQYEQYQGVLTSTTKAENEITRDGEATSYDRYYAIGWMEDSHELSRKTESKTYNSDNVLTASSESEGKLTYNKKKDARDYDYSLVSKQFSSKGYLKTTSKTDKTRSDKLNDDEDWDYQKSHSETTKTNRDGKVSYKYNTTTTYGNEGAYTTEETTKNYNTYTGALTSETVSKTEHYKNKKTDEWETDNTTTKTFNNDDGSLRNKEVVSVIDAHMIPGGYDGIVVEETHYNMDNKVAAKYTYDTKKNVGTWVDGNGKVIGKNETTDEETNDRTRIYGVDFKERTGELDSWTTYEKTTDKKGTKTETTTTYDEGKKSSVTEKITKDDDSWKSYTNGVLRRSYDPENNETKVYDLQGKLSSTQRTDEDKAVNTYNDNDKLIMKYEETEDADIWTEYDPSTGKATGSTRVYFNDDNEIVFEKRDGKDKVLYSNKTSYDEKLEQDVTVWYDAKDKEFARTYGEQWDWSTTGENQYPYTNKEPWDPENGSGEIERQELESESDYRKNTNTYNYTKWTVTNGKESNKLTRKDQYVKTWDNDKREENSYVGGTLTYNKVTEYNDYDDTAKETTKWFNWYDGKMTGMEKNIYTDTVDDKISYYKRYDGYSNLQEYSETDDTDEWAWKYSYYADGTFKGESWKDNMDYDSEYSSSYYLDGTMASEKTSTGKGDDKNGRYVKYNRNGTWSSWTDTVNGVSNTWNYNSNGELTGYTWNKKTDENGISSYEVWDAAGALVYTDTTNSYDDVNLEDGEPRVSVETKTDPAGNKWEKKDYNGETTITLTLKNKSNGWQYAVGQWFYLEKGEPVMDEWRQLDGSWYYFNWKGEMSTGLIPISDKKATDKFNVYAANEDGTVTSGWVGWKNANGDQKWAYTDASGEVLTGWQNLGGQWYYFDDGWYLNTDETNYKEDVEWKQSDDRGVMVTGAASIWNSEGTSRHTYFFNEDGTWDNSPGWKVTDGWYNIEYHYYDNTGREVTGWRVIDGDWYYFNEDGVLKNGWVKSGPNWYFMDPAKGGAMATDGWTEDVYEGWYYIDKNGNYKTGWLQDGNNWYYLKDDGSMAENEWAKSGSDWYYMDENGAMATGWIQDHGTWYCLKSDGTMKTGWEGAGNTWYYLDKDGAMVTDADVTIDGKTYHFDETGLCTNP